MYVPNGNEMIVSITNEFGEESLVTVDEEDYANLVNRGFDVTEIGSHHRDPILEDEFERAGGIRKDAHVNID